MTETREPYTVTGGEGRAEWHKTLVEDAWSLHCSAVDMVYCDNVRHGEHVPAMEFIAKAATFIEDNNTARAIIALLEAARLSKDEIQCQRIKELLAKIQ